MGLTWFRRGLHKPQIMLTLTEVNLIDHFDSLKIKEWYPPPVFQIKILLYLWFNISVGIVPAAFSLPLCLVLPCLPLFCVLCCPVCCVFLFASFVCFSCCLGISEGKKPEREKTAQKQKEAALNGVFIKNKKLKKSQNRSQKFFHFSCWHNLKSFDSRWLSDMSYII